MNDSNRTDYTPYRRTQIAELRPYVEGENTMGISISIPDVANGSPKLGDMIARNPDNHDDQWLVSADYFAKNFEPLPTPLAGDHPADKVSGEETSARVASIAGTIMAEIRRFPQTKIIEISRDDAAALAGSALTQAPNREPSNFLDRLKAERKELHDRLGKLAVFLGNGAPGTTPRHKAMLEEQSKLMSDLLAVLDERLCDLEITARTERSHAEPENADGDV